jgi:uncharacterized membrane protein (UPF0127 family)
VTDVRTRGGADDAPPRETAEPTEPQPSRCVVPFGDTGPRPAIRASACPAAPDEGPELPRGWVTFPEAPGAPRVAVEIANDSGSRERGLMYRTDMADDLGMIFTWSEERVRTFWMRNTCLPLDMLFIARDWTIVGILEQVPVMNDAPRRIGCPAAHVLELKAGWARGHGVAPGQRVDIDP